MRKTVILLIAVAALFTGCATSPSASSDASPYYANFSTIDHGVAVMDITVRVIYASKEQLSVSVAIPREGEGFVLLQRPLKDRFAYKDSRLILNTGVRLSLANAEALAGYLHDIIDDIDNAERSLVARYMHLELFDEKVVQNGSDRTTTKETLLTSEFANTVDAPYLVFRFGKAAERSGSSAFDYSKDPAEIRRLLQALERAIDKLKAPAPELAGPAPAPSPSTPAMKPANLVTPGDYPDAPTITSATFANGMPANGATGVPRTEKYIDVVFSRPMKTTGNIFVVSNRNGSYLPGAWDSGISVEWLSPTTCRVSFMQTLPPSYKLILRFNDSMNTSFVGANSVRLPDSTIVFGTAK
mgnify:CR=1 FL=1